MARYARHDEGAARPRRRRRSGGQEALWIALSIAAVVGIIMAFVISSGSSGEEEKREARAALDDLFRAFLEDDVEAGRKLLDPRQIMADLNQKKMKRWYDLTQEERDDLGRQAFNKTRTSVILQMKFRDKKMSDVEALLSGATVEYVPARNEVRFTWTDLGLPWQARLEKDDTDRWVVFDFRQVR